ncbi:hypothetical protein R6Q59_014216 [Mikania micrantha]
MSHTCTVSSIFTPTSGDNAGRFHFKIPQNTRKSSKISCSGVENSQNQQQQLNLSVLRFTLGIPGLDESYLPRWIGYGFGSLLVLNHFVSSNSTTVTPAQLRTEVLGLSLAAFSVMLPYIGQFLKGARPVIQASIPEGAEQIFVMSPNISDTIREDLAWGSYTLLRNTNSISVVFLEHSILMNNSHRHLTHDMIIFYCSYSLYPLMMHCAYVAIGTHPKTSIYHKINGLKNRCNGSASLI